MSHVIVKGLATETVRKLQRGGKDANGHLPEVQISDGNGNPCRHCLQMIAEGEEMLVLSHKPFEATQPYSEQGPIFLHRHECEPYYNDNKQLEILSNKESVIIRGYGPDERIIYGTGKVVPTSDIRDEARMLLDINEVSFVHVRSSVNNCYQMRIDRSDA